MSDVSAPSWRYLLIGGPSGVGKSSVSYPIARRFDMALTEVDDLFISIEALTDESTHPVLHYWRTHPDAPSQPAREILGRQLDVCEAMSPAIERVVANHVETDMPFVLDGDFITPAAAHNAITPNVHTRAVFLIEDDEAQIVKNFASREPQAGSQHKRAEVSWLFGQWLRDECDRLTIPVVAPRPWETVLERVLAAIR